MSKLSKAIAVIGCVALLCFMVPIKISSDNNIEEQFATYLEQFNKSYVNKTEYALRLNIFKQSLETIEKLNANKTAGSAQYGLTKFSDMTPDEFLNNHLKANLGARISQQDSSESEEKNAFIIKRDVSDIPKKFDWREKNLVTAVKNQKSCGACWAFCVIENMETMNAIKHKKLETLSVQEIIDCAGNGNDGCDGGDMCTLMQWMKKRNVSVVNEAEYPLRLQNGVCRLNKNSSGVQIDKFECNNLVGMEQYILTALSSLGPVAVAINALSWQHYLEGVIQYHCSASLNLANHAVQIVGYDLTAAIPHYIVRNSWGEDFGDKGYLYVAIGNNICGLANEVTILTVL